jgi:hypothetical protein
MVAAGRKRDLGAQVRRRDLQAEVAVMLGHRPVHLVDEDDVGLAGRKAGLDQLLEEGAGVDLAADALVLGALELEFGALANRFHERVGDQHSVVQVERLAVEVAARLPDLEEFLDLGMIDVEIAGGRPAPQRALRNRQRERVHHANKRDDPAGLAVEADRLADPADMAPIGADAAAAARQPDVLVPRPDDTLEAVGHAVQIAADRKAAPGPAVGQDRRRRHEPQARDVVVDALRVLGVVGVSRGDAGEEVLIGFARQQVAVAQRLLAEFGQQVVARRVGRHRKRGRCDALARRRGRGRHIAGRNFAASREIHRSTPSLPTRIRADLFSNRSTRPNRSERVILQRRKRVCHRGTLWKSGTSSPIAGI